MTIETPKAREIKRITTPLKFKDSKAYDSSGGLVKCSETLSDVRMIVEPRPGILTDDEILQYAPLSKSASSVRLKKGFGDFQDVLFIKESLPWYLALYYVVLICISIPVIFAKITIAMVVLLILFVLPLVYLYRIFRFDRYRQSIDHKEVSKEKDSVNVNSQASIDNDGGLESLKVYEKEINNLKVIFDVKQKVVRDLVKKRFEPPQITYDKFISTIDNSEKLFNSQAESALNIINLAVEDTPRVQNEIESKIDAMKTIINQIEDLTNELVINISSSDESTDEVKNLLEDMEKLTDSVKEY
jgi:uncharacterized membrane protein (DUF485 family)